MNLGEKYVTLNGDTVEAVAGSVLNACDTGILLEGDETVVLVLCEYENGERCFWLEGQLSEFKEA